MADTGLDEKTGLKFPAIISTVHRRFFLFSYLSFRVWGPTQEDRWREKTRVKPHQPGREAAGFLDPALCSCPFAICRIRKIHETKT
jgi:hypothetical protein